MYISDAVWVSFLKGFSDLLQTNIFALTDFVYVFPLFENRFFIKKSKLVDSFHFLNITSAKPNSYVCIFGRDRTFLTKHRFRFLQILRTAKSYWGPILHNKHDPGGLFQFWKDGLYTYFLQSSCTRICVCSYREMIRMYLLLTSTVVSYLDHLCPLHVLMITQVGWRISR